MMVSSPDSYRLAHLEAGIAVQRMYLACTAMYIECCSVGSFQDDEIRKSLDLFQTDWECVYAFAIGGVRRPKQQQETVAALPENKGLQLR
jgi:nitroreductase